MPEVGSVLLSTPGIFQIAGYRPPFKIDTLLCIHIPMAESEINMKGLYVATGREIQRELYRIGELEGYDGDYFLQMMEAERLKWLSLSLTKPMATFSISLCIERDVPSGTMTTVCIDQAYGYFFKADPVTARMCLFGRDAKETTTPTTDAESEVMIERFMQAFGDYCGIYCGGTDCGKPALLLHGIHGLPGSVELAPGSGVYRGGLEAAIEGVIGGKYKPKDFRFFLGTRQHTHSRMDMDVILGYQQPVSC